MAERVVVLTRALDETPHAFGGALALAYYAEPRATVDIDLNVFVTPDRFDDAVARHLSRLGIATDGEAFTEAIRNDGQGRVMWDDTPLDLFLAYDPFHDAAARAVRRVPFADIEIPVLAPEHLVVCKVVFDRPKDWVDIESMLDLGTSVDVAEVMRWVGRIEGDGDPRYTRIAALLTR